MFQTLVENHGQESNCVFFFFSKQKMLEYERVKRVSAKKAMEQHPYFDDLPNKSSLWRSLYGLSVVYSSNFVSLSCYLRMIKFFQIFLLPGPLSPVVFNVFNIERNNLRLLLKLWFMFYKPHFDLVDWFLQIICVEMYLKTHPPLFLSRYN